ncbi:MAG: adenylate/guanylate cyclase domain-containing protein [Actinomycetota bacterium]
MIATDTQAACLGAILFTDLVGFTEFNDAVGDARAFEVLDLQAALAGQAIASVPGARVVKELGDGLMIWIDTADAGLSCALELMRSVERARATGDLPLGVRMGMHHGEALPRGDDLVGQTINIGARVADLAGPGELLVSEALVANCGDVHAATTLRPVGPVFVKGVQDPIWLHRVVDPA